MGKEPSCVLNHEMIRRDLRDKGQSSMECPSCFWLLHPAKPIEAEVIFTQEQIDLIRELVIDVLVANDLIRRDDDD